MLCSLLEDPDLHMPSSFCHQILSPKITTWRDSNYSMSICPPTHTHSFNIVFNLSSLYILDINLLPETSFTKTFFHSVGWFLMLADGLLHYAEAFSFNVVSLIFAFVALLSASESKNLHQDLCQGDFTYVFF